MNYIFSTNLAHTRTNLPSPIGEPEYKKIGFVTPNFAISEISKPINMLSNDGTTNVICITR